MGNRVEDFDIYDPAQFLERCKWFAIGRLDSRREMLWFITTYKGNLPDAFPLFITWRDILKGLRNQ